jgi:hypothetical protein
MLPSRDVSVWVVYLTPKIERIVSLLSASPVGEARCRCRKVWLTRIDYYYYHTLVWSSLMNATPTKLTQLLKLSKLGLFLQA